MLLPLLSRQAAERAKMHAVMLRYTAATDGSDACIVASPVSTYMHVTCNGRLSKVLRFGRLGKVLRFQYAWRASALRVPFALYLIRGFRPSPSRLLKN